jgi:hypothetical protein
MEPGGWAGGSRRVLFFGTTQLRFIPVRAGNARRAREPEGHLPVHLRACEERVADKLKDELDRGSSPDSIIVLDAAAAPLLGLRHAAWWWIIVMALAWLIGYFATKPADLSALRLSPFSHVVLSYALCLAGASMCYAIGQAVSML